MSKSEFCSSLSIFITRGDFMKSIYLLGVFLAAIFMLAPWALLVILQKESNIGARIFLFLFIHPMASILIGFLAGKRIHPPWPLPFLSALLFFLGTRMVSDDLPLSIMFAMSYLSLGCAAVSFALLKGSLLRRASVCASGALSAVAMWAYLILLYTEIFPAAVVCALIFAVSLLLSSYLYLTEAR